jgi:peptidoglycan/LPS O-acetylase OafA/YrhL
MRGRDIALDGLRGVAAVVVLTSHLLVAGVPALAGSIRAPGTEHATAFEWR